MTKPLIQYFLALLLAPLLPGIINRVKAFFGGRRGVPLFQLYFDLYKLARKVPVYSRTTTWLFRFGPVAGLAAMLCALMIVPFGGRPSFLSFEGDLILLVYLLGLARFTTVLAALDTGSGFEGMGASREAQFAVFAEPAFFLALAALARGGGGLSLSGIFSNLTPAAWLTASPILTLVTASLFIVFLAENSRVPVDDPNTHLELTMIHEVMVLDHSGPDLAFIFYGAALKLWTLGALIACVILPRHSGSWLVDSGAFVLAMFALAAAVGVVESVMGRLRLLKVPHLLMTALTFSILALIFQAGR
ncbi:MAG: hydrogenase [Elusimicrobia bacterium GWA2_56_46]|nr:MAG: hydrogenase [Elusimicrobia bacterium GWA2_56_46]OGR55990.1 MAG: hydrogenase [Elusimicrobia bacterium GWC2_56_31]HBW22374.1 hydrogenase [Elusimicrobiota bacterium]